MSMSSPMPNTTPMASHPPGFPPLVLASSSPRRQQLLASLGLNFSVITPDLDEDQALQAAGLMDAPPQEQVLALATAKAQAVSHQIQESNTLILASDTTVAIGGRCLGKPKTEEEAFEMLSLLQDNVHQVWTAITLLQGDRLQQEVGCTSVWFKPMSPDRIRAYIQTQEPMDKAGAYAIQGKGSVLVQRIEGCYFNVMGLSLTLLDTMLLRWGYQMY